MPPVITTSRFESVYSVSLAPRDPMPVIPAWNRLEGRPRTADFERSLRSEIRDPLWFLTRQWQYGEYQAEDAGSPIEASVALRTALLDSFSVGETTAPYDANVPLEVRIEREPAAFDLMMHMQVSRYFERLLKAAGVGATYADLVSELSLTAAAVAGVDSADAQALFNAGGTQMLDAKQLLASIEDGTFEGIAAPIAGGTGPLTKIKGAADDLLAWFTRMYARPAGEPNAWKPSSLAYGFETSASAAQVAMVAPHYAGGHLDWYAFDAAARQSETAPPETVVQSFIPAAISFAGMPSSRYWEMESAQTEFGHIDVNTNDLAKLLLAEFMLMYSNDWCLVPLELPIGSVTQLDGIVVTDVFGEQMLVRAADYGGDVETRPWSMFRLSDSGSPQAPDGSDVQPSAGAGYRAGLMLPPALMKTVEATPLEKVLFLRDEMANMVWAVEDRVASKLGDGVPGQLPEPELTVDPAAPPDIARYILGTHVPPHWRPFIPVHIPGSSRSIRLQRARLPTTTVPLRTEVLRIPGNYFVDEEEVPRAGRVVTRSYQRARWLNGTTFLWLGRKSTTGRGEGSSGLVFDHLDEQPAR